MANKYRLLVLSNCAWRRGATARARQVRGVELGLGWTARAGQPCSRIAANRGISDNGAPIKHRRAHLYRVV